MVNLTKSPRRLLFALSLPLLLSLATAARADEARPAVQYANILGGSQADKPTAVAAGPGGYLYITGKTSSADFPDARRLSTAPDAADGNVFVAKIDPSGGRLIYSVIIGGGNPVAIAVDAAGSAYVTGVNASSDFPTTPGAIATTGSCFLFKLDAAASRLVYSARLACQRATDMYPGGLTVDAAGNAYLTGSSGEISTTPGAFRTSGFGPFAMKVNAQGSALIYATYLPADADLASAHPRAIAVDASGNAYITGSANQRGFPATVNTLPAEQRDPGSSSTTTDDVFVLKLSADGTRVAFSALFGGYGSDYGSAIALDAADFIYVAGSSRVSTGFGPETPFPTTSGAFDRIPAFPKGFLAKLFPSGDKLAFSTFLPETHQADCVGIRNNAVEVLAFQMGRTGFFPELQVNRLLRVTGDGTSLLYSSIVSARGIGFCGQGDGTVGLAWEAFPFQRIPVTSPDLERIGPAGQSDVWFSAVSTDSLAPKLEVNTGELRLSSWMGPDGSFPPVNESIGVVTGGIAVPLGIFGYDIVSVSPAETVTPAQITVTAPQGRYTDRLVLFAPGAQDSLAILPVSMSEGYIQFNVQPDRQVRLFATGPDAPPVRVALNLSSSATSVGFGNTAPAPLDFKVKVRPAVSWLRVDPMSGRTPTQIRVTADPAGLNLGSVYSATVEISGPDGPSGWWGEPAITKVYVRFAVGPIAPAPPSLVVKPSGLSLRVTSDHPSDSATVRLESTGDPISFTIDSVPASLVANPTSGTTPADLTVSTSLAPVSERRTEFVQIRRKSDAAAIGSFAVVIQSVLPDYVGSLNPAPMSWQRSEDDYAPLFAPGALFYVQLDPLLAAPLDPIVRDPGALAPSLGGYSFTMNGLQVPLRSYANREFLAQIPAELEPGSVTLDALDSGGRRVATASLRLGVAAPKYLERIPDSSSARRANGSIVNASNPARVGESILVRLTGQGAVVPPVASGSAASPGATPSRPVLPVTATIGRKPATLLSASMSVSEAGVLDVWLQVPELRDSDHYVSVHIGGVGAGMLPVRVQTGVPVPRIAQGGVVNAASYLRKLAPGSLFSIFGSGLATQSLKAERFPLPYRLGEASVTIGGKPAPLLYVSPGQINAQVPYEVVEDEAAPVVVTVNGVSSAADTVPVLLATPGIFEFGQNRSVVQNQDYSLNNTDHGATPGSYVIAYLTGSGKPDNPVVTGMPTSAEPFYKAVGIVVATVNGLEAEVTFAGLTPGFAGLMQVNMKVPNLPPGTYPLVVYIDGEMSNSALVTID
jgi:uncharacterized protein (TIGR03437 family)